MPPLRPRPTWAGTLELKATKEGAHSARITCVAFHPTGGSIVSGGWDGHITTWTLEHRDAGDALYLTKRATFFGAHPLSCMAMHSSFVVAGTLTGELVHLRAEED